MNGYVRGLSARISGTHASSLGLHPAVYFYGVTGRYQPPAFLATVRFIQELERKNELDKFTECRAAFEEFLLTYRYFTNAIIGKFGGGTRSLDPLVLLYRKILDGIEAGTDNPEIVDSIYKQEQLLFLRAVVEENKMVGKRFSREVKSMAFIRDALEVGLRCAICKARIHKRSITIDHILRKADGGHGDIANAQLSHPYCNTSYKN